MKKHALKLVASAAVGVCILSGNAFSQDDEMKKAMDFFSNAGIPGDRWTEGETMVPHVAPAPHFKRRCFTIPAPRNYSRMRFGLFSWDRPTTPTNPNLE